MPEFDTRSVVDDQRYIKCLEAISTSSAGKIFELRSKVIGVYDKGKGSVVETETLPAENNGQDYVQILGSMGFVCQGGWGGPKGDSDRLSRRRRPSDRQLSVS